MEDTNKVNVPGEIKPKLSLGEQRVRITFNINNNSVVDQLKSKTAELINLCEQLKTLDGRCASIAQTEFETACMYAVKAATATVDPMANGGPGGSSIGRAA